MTERNRDDGEKRYERGESEAAQVRAPEPPRAEPVPTPGEAPLFRAGAGPQLFGEGGYATGGSNEEGNYEVRDAHPHGSYGSFDDAGGYGATQLLGEATPHGGSSSSQRTPPMKPKPAEGTERS